MQTKILQLVRPVEVEGPSLFAPSRALVKISPPEQGQEFEWIYVSPSEITRINTDNIHINGMQNMSVIQSGRTTAHVLEHFLPLKFFGLFGLRMSSTHCLPYFGNALPFVDQVLRATKEVVLDLPVITVSQKCSWFYPKKRAGRTAFTALSPRSDGKVVMSVTIDYQGLGLLTKTYAFPDDELLYEISSVRTQGWPRSRFLVSRVLSAVGLWRHHNSVEWPQNYVSTETVLNRFCDHRALDLLGALGLLVNGHRLSVDVVSVCSGHFADIEVCRLAQNNLVITA